MLSLKRKRTIFTTISLTNSASRTWCRALSTNTMIHSISEIQEGILGCDGSCRDLNFLSSDREAVANLIRWFTEHFDCLSACDNEGVSIQLNSIWQTLKGLAPTKSIQIGGESSRCVIDKVQVFLFIEDDGTVDIEITFFPQDIKSEEFEIASFLQLIKFWHTKAGANIGYLRYENASWKYGDTSRNSGVIHVSKNT